ncbi:MAG: SUF system NifU family Fe-S cluster assembly protein [Clostridiales bacterium]|nr:SUF system NifU family Fe-S cluster assembly protein [Clostridiales bacterium]
MPNNTFYNEILTEHNIRPFHKKKLENPDFTLEGVNPSCGDDIILALKVDNGVITDGAFEGDGCAISQASCDMMLDLIIGRSKEEALELADIFLRMIKSKITDEEKDRLEEAGILEDISHMPARVKCAVLGWHTMEEIFKGATEGSATTEDM